MCILLSIVIISCGAEIPWLNLFGQFVKASRELIVSAFVFEVFVFKKNVLIHFMVFHFEVLPISESFQI